MRSPVVGTTGVNGLLSVKPVEGLTGSEIDPASVELLRVQQLNVEVAKKWTNKW